MSAERPTPNDMPRKRKAELIDDQGWPSGKAHLEIVERTSCGCINCLAVFPIEKKGITEALERYADINLKVHHSNREAGWRTVWQEAEEILKTDS